MNILATNDDGFECLGITKLADYLRRAGHNVLVMSPDKDMSGTSHSISLRKTLQIKELEENFWVCKGTPVDCAALVIAEGLDFKPDIVVSGINAGANIGTDIIYSGTAAAARQAALSGIPAIAFSLVAESGFFWDEASKWAVEHLEKLLKLWNKEVFINVNMPNLEVQKPGFELTFPVKRHYYEKMGRKGGPDGNGWIDLYYSDFVVETDESPGSDYDTVERGIVSVSRVLMYPRGRKGW